MRPDPGNCRLLPGHSFPLDPQNIRSPIHENFQIHTGHTTRPTAVYWWAIRHDVLAPTRNNCPAHGHLRFVDVNTNTLSEKDDLYDELSISEWVLKYRTQEHRDTYTIAFAR